MIQDIAVYSIIALALVFIIAKAIGRIRKKPLPKHTCRNACANCSVAFNKRQ